jgi:hypothetical protein
MMTDTDDPDIIALRECFGLACEDPTRKRQLESMLEDRDWFTVARFACRCVQDQTLGLRPWEKPPCVVSDDFADEPHNQRAAVKLLQKMLAAGVSRYHPDPMAALGLALAKR